ncbi:protein SFI1 homolog isoform X2 [Myripristis murdjan]|uniref:protein SFI1 homolog isoform X2 n=1 Tax=Myripristis murdjan TaxID=586833 RepID=UPI0011762121|nr:protein SFI1 homolog isoform X2 [Myripristis murdjan]
MQTNTRKPQPLKSRVSTVRSGGETKVHSRKVPYRVGYTWNRGGRLKELRIRHLARKFLNKWIYNTFGRVHPQKARCHHARVVLLRAFGAWRDEWWSCRREWSLTVRAQCHYRYYLYNWIFHSWRGFVSVQREKKKKVQNAQSFAEDRRMHLVWDRWEIFLEMRRMKRRMNESALQKKKLAVLRSAWSAWQMKLQQRHDLHALEEQALQQRALTLQRMAWLKWKELHTAACSQREKESKASLHFILGLRRKALTQWIRYVSYRQAKKQPQAVAVRAQHLRLVRGCWSKWRNGLYRKWSEEDRQQAAGHLSKQSIQRWALERWRTYVNLCREEAERNHIATQHHQLQLLRAGLQGLSLNVSWSKVHRLNKNMAVQHCCQTITSKYWRLWQDRLEEAEDKAFHPQVQMALTHYSTSLLSSCFRHWTEKLAERRYMQGLEHRAEAWFAQRMLPQCFTSWVEFTLQRRLHKKRREKAEVYNRQRQYTWVFYTWWEQSEKRKEEMLSVRMAILHEERCHAHRAWAHWRQRTQQQIDEREKQRASDSLYMHRLLQKTVKQWKDNSTEIRDRRNREEQACHQGDLRRMRWAVDRWKEFVQGKRVKHSRLEQMKHYHETKLLRHALEAWKKHQLQMAQIYSHAEKMNALKTHCFLRRILATWRENASLLAETRIMEQKAQNHFQHHLQLKVLLAWRVAATCAVSKLHQQGEILTRAQNHINQVSLRGIFNQWRKQTRKARTERMDSEKARQHHYSRLLSHALKAWKKHHHQYHKHQVMKRQGLLLLRLKTCQRYFEQWKTELQHRRKEAQQTELALWHWSLTLQAKVVLAWRLWVTERHKKNERLAGAAQFYRDQLLREGVAHVLTYVSHMKSFTSSLAERSQEQSSQHIQRVVRRCAMRWKQRTLCKAGRTQGVGELPPKKSVTFCLPAPGSPSTLHGLSCSDSVARRSEDGVLRELAQTRAARCQPRRCKELLESPVKMFHHNGIQGQAVTSTNTKNHIGGHQHTIPPPLEPGSSLHTGLPAVRLCLQPPTVPMNPKPPAVTQPHMPSTQGRQNQDVLLPPSAFITTNSQLKPGKTSNSSPGDASLVPPHHFVSYSSSNSGVCLRAASEGAEVQGAEEPFAGVETDDPTSTLTRELLRIQLDMKGFQQDRKQLRAWQRLKEVLKTWLHTSGKEEQMEKSTVSQELMELEEDINRLSTELEKQRPKMLLHAARVRHLQTLLRTSGADFLPRPPEERETNLSVLTT